MTQEQATFARLFRPPFQPGTSRRNQTSEPLEETPKTAFAATRRGPQFTSISVKELPR